MNIEAQMSGMDVMGEGAGARAAAKRGCGVERWRCGRRVVWSERPSMVAAWVAGLAGMCVGLGVWGLWRPVELAGVDFGGDGPVAERVDEWMLVEMAGELEAFEEGGEPVDAAAAERDEWPEMVEALSVDDVFEVSAAEPVLEMVRQERAMPAPAPARPAAPAATGRPATPRGGSASGSATGSATGGSEGAAGGRGGGGAAGGAGRAGYFPTPPYPAEARRRGQQGTVQLTIVFAADGRVTNASVSRSSGYSELDRTAAQWVRRHWRAASNQVGTFRLPVHFKLR